MNSEQIRKTKRGKYKVKVSSGEIEFYKFNGDTTAFVLENMDQSLFDSMSLNGGKIDEGSVKISGSTIVSLMKISDYVLANDAVEPISKEDIEYIKKEWPSKDKLKLSFGICEQIGDAFDGIEKK